ncbi:MAG: MBL fold metallo-hydrolase [Planctomycetes bacterium]|nr:MBL fold metallo-hydrolase [Planctomycetota bacterium]
MNSVQAELLVAGSCTHPEHIVHGNWRLSSMQFPATFALIRHPDKGLMLYDTGYSTQFLKATEKLPERLYRWITPVTIPEDQTAAAQLRARGIDPEDVKFVILSHFHADHVGGLVDFPRAQFLFLEDAWKAVKDLSGLSALRRAFLPALLPTDFRKRGQAIETGRPMALPSELDPFTHGHDIFGDGSMYAVELDGHAIGQMGLVLRLQTGAFWFLVADACWTSRCYRERISPHVVTRLLFNNTREYRRTLARIGDLSERSPEVQIIPSHCTETLRSLSGAARS